MDKLQAEREILNLVDSNPDQWNDISSILERYTLNADYNQENQVRQSLKEATIALIDSGEIRVIAENQINSLTKNFARDWSTNSCLIAITQRRKEKIEYQTNNPNNKIHLPDAERLPAEKPIYQDDIQPANNNKNNSRTLKIWEYISNNGIISGIILAGILALIGWLVGLF